MSDNEVERPSKRFKHESYAASLKTVHLPSVTIDTRLDEELLDTESHFYRALQNQRQLNLAPSFLRFANSVDRLSQTLPLLVLNAEQIVTTWVTAIEECSKEEEGLRALLDVLTKLIFDLRRTLEPSFERIYSKLLGLSVNSLSADILTQLLEALSSLLRYISPTTPDSLQRVYSQFSEAFRKCKPEIQRASGEVWGAAMRRLKADLREKGVLVMLERLKEHDGSLEAWSFIYACKSVSQSLHSATSWVITTLVDAYIKVNESVAQTFVLLRRILTSLMHHVPSAEAYEIVSSVILTRLSLSLETVHDESLSADMSEVERLMELATVLVEVRKGSRVYAKQLTPLLTSSSSLKPNKTSLSLALAILTSTHFSTPSSVAMNYFDHIFKTLGSQSPPDKSELHTLFSFLQSLLELGYSQFKSIAFPLLMRRIPSYLCADTDSVRHLVALISLIEEKKMLEGSKSESFSLGEVIDKLRVFEDTKEQVVNVFYILSITRLLPRDKIVQFVADQLKELCYGSSTVERKHELQEMYQMQWHNPAWSLGKCLRASARIKLNLDVCLWEHVVTHCLTLWPWNGWVIEGLQSFASARKSEIPKEFRSVIVGNLRHHSQQIRLPSLLLLSGSSMSAELESITGKLLEAEHVPLTVQGVRDRVFKIKLLGPSVKSAEDAHLATMWLLGQLKVNLHPLWAASVSAIAAMNERYPDTISPIFLEEVQKAERSDCLLLYEHPDWWEDSLGRSISEGEDGWHEEERTWRDGNGHAVEKAKHTFDQFDSIKNGRVHILKNQVTRERLDVMNYNIQLLNVLAESPSLLNRHLESVMSLFLDFSSSSTPARSKLCTWLKILPKCNFSQASLPLGKKTYERFLHYASFPDISIQAPALDCILSFMKQPSSRLEGRVSELLPNEVSCLSNLLNEKLWRDELVNFKERSDIPLDKENSRFTFLLVRILYGILRDRRRGGGSGKAADMRRACLRLLEVVCRENELQLLTTLMLDPFSPDQVLHRPITKGEVFQIPPLPSALTERQSMGFLMLMEDVLRILRCRLEESELESWRPLLCAVITITATASQKMIGGATSSIESNPLEMEIDGEEHTPLHLSPSRFDRSIRQVGIKRLADFSRTFNSLDLSPYMPSIFEVIISPRLSSQFPSENSQSPSALMELFVSWSSSALYRNFLLTYDDRLLPLVIDILAVSGVKATVVNCVFEIIENLVSLSESCPTEANENTFEPFVVHTLSRFAVLMRNNPTYLEGADHAGKRGLSLLVQLAQLARSATQVCGLIEIFIPILRKSSKTISEKNKAEILKIYAALLPLLQAEKASDLDQTPVLDSIYQTLSVCFQTLRSREARLKLVDAFQALCRLDSTRWGLVTEILTNLNSYSERRPEEPDFDRRLSAFARLNEDLYKTLPALAWPPILHNMLCFVQETEEFSLRVNASATMKRYIDRLALDTRSSQLLTIFNKVLLSGIKNGLRTKSEAVRVELVSVYHHAVIHCTEIKTMSKLRALLVQGDEEADFFNNIHHIQIHRRARALRRLSEVAEREDIPNTTLAEIFVPLVGNFVQNPKLIDPTLASESITTLGRIARQLQWTSYYSLVQQYLKLSRAGGENERVHTRALVAILDGFHFAMEDVEEDVEEEADLDVPFTVPEISSEKKRISDIVNTKLLPSLLNHLDQRGEIEDNLRVPVSTGIIRIALHLPTEAKNGQITRLLTVLSQILRSKSQDTRELVKDTLCRSAITLGNEYLPVMIKELRAALLRGPHLHILASTVHSILSHVAKAEHLERFAILDKSASDAVHVAAEVVFGQSGKDVLSEGFKSTVKEVKGSSNRGLEIFMLLSRNTSPATFSTILHPVRAVLHESDSSKVMQAVDEVLKRIASGFNANTHLGSLDLLSLCHTLIQGNAKFLQENPSLGKKVKGKRRGEGEDYVVNTKVKKIIPTDHYSTNSYKFVSLGLDLLGTAFRRNRFDLQDPKTIGRMEPLVAVIGNSLYASNSQIIILALRALAVIIKFPLKSLPDALPVFVRQILQILRTSGTTESESSQAALRTLTTVIRDSSDATVQEKDLTFLLELCGPDIEEPNRQSASFGLLKAIVSRKFVIPEIYDSMGKIAEVMVTSQSPQTQELCRSVLLQFLLEYPQGKGRFRKQMLFLARNLSYSHESGRISVMEFLGAIITKFNEELVREYSGTFFVALVMSLANEDSTKCKQMVIELIRSLISKHDPEQRKDMLVQIQVWSGQHDSAALVRVGFQVYTLVFDVLKDQAGDFIPGFHERLAPILEKAADFQGKFEAAAEEGDPSEAKTDWQSLYQSLCALEKLAHVTMPATALSAQQSNIIKLLLYPHAWVRKSCCRLIGIIFADTKLSSSLSDADLLQIANKLCSQLKSRNLDSPLALQIVKNLFYVGKRLNEGDNSDTCEMAAAEIVDGSDNEDEREEMNEQLESELDKNERHRLPWLFSKLSYQARSAYIARIRGPSRAGPWDIAFLSAVRWFAAMSNYMDSARVERFLVHMLSPIYRVLDDDFTKDPQMGSVKTSSQEFLDLLQSKVGVTKFSAVYNQIRQGIMERRRERRENRVMQAVQNPQAAAKRKAHRNELKKDSKKRRDRSFADSKIRNNPVKRRKIRS